MTSLDTNEKESKNAIENDKSPYNNIKSMMDPSNMISVMMTNMISDQMLSVMKSQNGISIYNILKLLAMMSMNELRKICMTILTKTGTFIQENYMNIFDWIKRFLFLNNLFKIAGLFKNKKETAIIEDNTEIIPTTPHKKTNVILIHIEPTLSFMQTLINYIKTSSNVTVDIRNEKQIKMENIEKKLIVEHWSNINIKYNELNILIDSQLELKFYSKKNKMILSSENTFKNENVIRKRPDMTSIKTFIDLIEYDKIKDLIKKIVIEYFGKGCYEEEEPQYNRNVFVAGTWGKMFSSANLMLEWIDKGGGAVSNYFEINIIEFLKKKIPNLNKKISLIELVIWEIICKKTYNNNIVLEMYNSKENFVIYSTIFNISEAERKSYFEQTQYILSNYVLQTAQIHILGNVTDIMKRILLYDNVHLKMNMEMQNNNSTYNSIRFYAHSETLSQAEINYEFNKFLQFVDSYIEEKTPREPTKSYVIMIESIEHKSKMQNPEYVVYEKQKVYLENLTKPKKIDDADIHEKSKKTDNADSMLLEFLLRKDMPPETIDTLNTEKKILVKEINEIYKNFNTLYLRKHDIEKLKNILEMFYDNRELWEEMGIPNKLGILLHGLPGTGKSSTIAAIATYMKKDIYCVDFKTIKSNSDFMMMVEYVNKHCKNGGILTFEDIDAMSEILHKRFDETSSESNTTADLCGKTNGDLTLDYILNVFQGSLTPSGFIFIATTNHLSELDKALYRDGRFDVKIDMKLCDHYQIQCMYNKIIKRIIPEHLLNRIDEDRYTPSTILFRIIHYARGDHDDELILEPFLNPS
jgi:ATP-dependent 26S proteasome regulatory subunit